MTKQPPRIDDAPGLIFTPRKSGMWSASWRAQEPGFQPQTRWLSVVDDNPDQELCEYIASWCQVLQAEMLEWRRGPVARPFDGTLRSLIEHYQTDPDSTFQTIRYNTRNNYVSKLNKLLVHGAEKLEDLTARAFLGWYRVWSDGRSHEGHSCISMLRTVISYGATFLEDPECIRLKAILHGQKFATGKPRTKVLTAEMVVAIRAKAHELGRPSIALAQALQFECTLRQKDVIGEWAPLSELGVSDVLDHGKKWMRGLRWEEIDANLILVHVTSKKQKEIVVDLKLAPMVMEELERQGRGTSGPVIIDEKTGLPYRTFTQRWRPIARAAGVPDDVWQMDTRAGAISEGTDVASIEDVRHAAAHSNISMTQRYSRTGAKKTANVMTLRAALRTRREPPREE